MLLLYGSANRDPREFGPTAEAFDVGRRSPRCCRSATAPTTAWARRPPASRPGSTLEELLDRCPRFSVDHEAGTFAPGHFVRRYETLPFVADAG